MNKPILTIAIPTWNRANILNDALSALLPQIESHKNNIEVIISDNASNDNTDEVIKKQLLENNTLNIVHNTQQENTGYFGNFQKCRSLSNGVYFWLLSDNDFIAKGLVNYVLELLLLKKPSFIFLKDWKHASKVSEFKEFKNKSYPVFEGFEKFNYNTTLISAVIFKNYKKNDKELFNHFKGNTFLGFTFFLESLYDKSDAIEIIGTSLFIKDTKVSFNAFKSFAIDLTACFDYAVKNNILPKKSASIFINKVISELTIRQYILFRIKGSIHGQTHKKENIDSILNSGFFNYKAFKEQLNPLIKANGLNFYKLIFINHLKPIIKNRYLKSH